MANYFRQEKVTSNLIFYADDREKKACAHLQSNFHFDDPLN